MQLIDENNVLDNPAYVFGDKVANICAPLFSKFPINYFSYSRRYPGDKLLCLTSDAKWLRSYIRGKHRFLSHGGEIHSWVSSMSEKAQQEAASNFGYHNGIVLEKVRIDHIEILEFASPTKNTSPLEFCCNKDLLNQFFIYFKDRAVDIISAVEKEPIYLPKGRFLEPSIPSGLYDDFCREVNTKKIKLQTSFGDLSLSHREFEVLYLFSKGKCAKEAAEVLQISRRTVESYLYGAKNRSGMFTVNQLLDCFNQSLL